MRGMGSRIPRLLALLFAVVVYIAHALRFSRFLADDALISLQYSRRLIAGDGLTWCDGNLVEGYSNLLWVLLCAVPGFFGVDLILTARIGGFLGMGAVLLALVFALPRTSHVSPFAAALFFAMSGSIAVWTFGGLEAPLYAGLLAWVFVAVFRIVDESVPPARWLRVASLLLALLALTRPDGLLFTGALVGGIWLARGFERGAWRWLARLVVVPVAAALVQLLFRLFYYGDWFPNTAFVKVGFSVSRVVEGASYLGSGLAAHLELSLLSLGLLLVALADVAARRRAIVVLVTVAAWGSYVVFIGGDVFEAYRHLVPLIVLLCCGLVVGLESLHARWVGRGWSLAIGLVLCALFGSFGWRQLHDVEITRAAENEFVWYGQGIATTLASAFHDDDPLLAVSAAGCFPYWTDFRCLDMLGLNDRHIARSRPENFGQGPLAHELGDTQYLLDRQPDLMFIGAPGPGVGRQLSGHYEGLLQDPRFEREYLSVRLSVPEPRLFSCYLWVRSTSPRIGIRREKNTASIPLFLFNGNPSTSASLGGSGELGVVVAPDRPAYFLLDETWPEEFSGIEVFPPAPGLRAGTMRTGDGNRWLAVESAEPIWLRSVGLSW